MPKSIKQTIVKKDSAKCYFCSSDIDSLAPEAFMHCKIRMHESALQVACPSCSMHCEEKECDQ